ncbi:uroporphyrinogen-III synthase [Acetobacteraceae bacterium KSS8]|uniref:Uroporphyrinogen-III synthase n=1 Tax=Endosaccharibacter trunci TaxID=2812733 RepID=A0ABT1W7B6_9PROT|nr:uroporphyrinogen-III synthase [Acetobacteraceae bacterium KSS8]
MKRTVLVTRPEPGLGETMRAVAAMGFTPLATPMLRIVPLKPALPARVQAVLFTSGQAVGPLADQAPLLLGATVLSVGDATAERARDAGFTRVASARGDAKALASLAARRLDPAAGSLLLACGRGQGGELVEGLRSRGFRVLKRCVYQAVAARALDETVLARLRSGRVEAVLFFSGETAVAFERAVPPDLSLDGVRALAISAKAASRLSEGCWRSVSFAETPDAAALLALLQQ